MINFPENIGKQQFLNEYWQKQPLLFKNAINDSDKLISKQQLFELSTSDEVESRLLMEDGPDEPWQVFHGPQNHQQLDSLAGSSHWTLLVQSVNLWNQDCAELLKHFRFIPEWRLDDIMISFANESGSVGPHLDHYDVFLIQLSGSRRWIVGNPNAEVEMLRPGTDCQHIKPFSELSNDVLQAGDMLYIPPNTAHHGISIEPGMTLSVGFRSPALSEIMMVFAEQIMLNKQESYFDDPLFNASSISTEISAAAMSKAVNWLSNLDDFNDIKRKSFGLLQTQPKQDLIYLPIETPILDYISDQQILYRDPAARVAWYQANESIVWLFINGECFERSLNEKLWITHICHEEHLSSDNLKQYIENDEFINLLQLCVDCGLFGIK